MILYNGLTIQVVIKEPVVWNQVDGRDLTKVEMSQNRTERAPLTLLHATSAVGYAPIYQYPFNHV
jgi:hypothetical protein